jgi:hypothetical protein
MATSAQITANRANAQKSTGPRSVEGKSASRFNALKHGIDAASIVIPGEDPADYDALAADYLSDLRPQSTSEAFNVQTMLRADWQKRRLQIVEADLFRTLLAESPGASLAAALLSESPAAKLLARVQRQIAAFERTWYRANAELRRSRKDIEDPAGQSLVNHLENFFNTPTTPDPPELASFPQPEDMPLPDSPAGLTSAPDWPPTDEKTGRPLYFVG